MLAQVREVFGRQVVEQVSLWLVDLRGHAIDAAVDVRDEDDTLARVDEVHQRRRRTETRGERDSVVCVLERGERGLERRSRRIRDACVVVALVLADGVLDERRRLVDRRDDRARRRDRAPGRRGWRGSRSPSAEFYERTTRSAPSTRARRASAASRPSSSSPRTPGSGWNALTTSVPLGALVLQVGAADEPVAPQQRQHVVAVDPLGLALVDLDHVAEAEDALEVVRSQTRLSNGERRTRGRHGAVGLDGGRDEHGRLAVRRPRAGAARPPRRVRRRAGGRRAAALQPPHLRDRGVGQCAARTHAAQCRPADELVAGRSRAHRARRAGSSRSGRSYRRWKPSRPAIASRPAECSASSTTFAGFQFHIPPLPVPSKCREPSGAALARSRAVRARSAPARARTRCRATDATPRGVPSASGASDSPRPGRGTPRAPSTRRSAPRASASRRPAPDTRRSARRARVDGCARRSRSSRAGRTPRRCTVASTSAAVPARARAA